MKPEEALHKMMRHNNDEKPEKLDLRAIILGSVIGLLCIALPLGLVWLLKVMKVTSGMGKF
ncbi:MAG: hypothetical protein KOO64_10150 [Desulfobacterales bacterium]|nr:hypothetical protein [Desulfobacterales bacterium]